MADIFRLRVAIRQEHIAAGEVSNSERCPLALALTEHLAPQHGAWYVGTTHAYVCRGIGAPALAEVQLPRRTSRFVRAFDAGELVQPFTTILTVHRQPEAQGDLWEGRLFAGDRGHVSSDTHNL